VGDDDWPEVTDWMLDIADQIRLFYARDGCSVGGPLHVYLDDFNVEDHWFYGHTNADLAEIIAEHPTYKQFRQPAENFDTAGPEIGDHARGIMFALSSLTESERSVTVAIAHNMLPHQIGAVPDHETRVGGIVVLLNMPSGLFQTGQPVDTSGTRDEYEQRVVEEATRFTEHLIETTAWDRSEVVVTYDANTAKIIAEHTARQLSEMLAGD
jgi:hypothetical protein